MKRLVIGVLLICTVLLMVLPMAAFAQDKYTYSTVYIDKIDEPVAGKTPDVKGVANARFGGMINIREMPVTITWDGQLDENGCFKSGTVYTITATVKAEDIGKFNTGALVAGEETGKALLGGIKNNTGKNMTVVSCTEDTLVVKYSYPMTPGTNRSEVRGFQITDLEKPEPGKNPDTKATLKISASEGQGADAVIDEIKWVGTLDENGCFIAGKTYAVDVTVKITDTSKAYFDLDYINSTVTAFRVNYDYASVRTALEDTVVVRYTYEDIRAMTQISSINITGITPPKQDQQPDRTAVIDNQNLEINEINWHSTGWGQYDSNNKYAPFEGGREYEVRVLVKLDEAKPGYEFARPMTATVNGETAKVTYGLTNDYVEISYSFPKIELKVDGNIKAVDIGGVVGPYVFRQMEVPTADVYPYRIADYEWSEGATIYGEYKDDTVYTLTIVLEAVFGNAFSEKNLGTVGKTTPYSDGYKIASFSENRLVLEKTYPKTTTFVGEKPATLIKSPYVFSGGSGTYEDPYLIKTADQLNAVRFGLDKHYRLISDIDLSTWGNWIPIGSNEGYGGSRSGGVNHAYKHSESFTGSFDGNGHVISGMTIKIHGGEVYMREKVNTRYYGLFQTIDANQGTKIIHNKGDRYSEPYTSEVHKGVRNLGIVDFVIDIHHSEIKNDYEIYAGAISGNCHGVGVYNCYSKGGTMKFDLRDGEPQKVLARIGGLTGDSSWTDFRYCYNASDITVLARSDSGEINELEAGGISGASTACWFMSCFNKGNITLPQYNDVNLIGFSGVAGGITTFAWAPEFPVLYHSGEEKNNYIWNCYNSGTITSEYACGIMYHGLSDFYVDNCYNVGELNSAYHVNSTNTVMTTKFPVLDDSGEVKPFGTEYIRRIYTDGNSVSGDQWINSPTLGRKVLKAVREDQLVDKKPSFFAYPGKTPFEDVAVGSYYEDAVAWALRNAVTSGTSTTTFSPNKTCTRAEVVTFLWRSAGSPKPARDSEPFSDVGVKDWYREAVIWAIQKGITNGTSATTFSPNNTCTSAEVVTFLHRANKVPAASGTSALAKKYADQWYTDAIAWADTTGLLKGVGAEFAPGNPSPRADIVTYLHRNTLNS